ncbi:PilZ domain-containing protein [Sphingomonas sp.]|uniref:PilZ domain-containing protein n=1 Tax=Sphingomonas sp. TaxID=28214 RepID=UPI003AFFDA4A
MASAFEMPEDKRDSRRQRLLLTAQMDFEDGTRDVHLLNISATGAKLDCEAAPSHGEAVTLICGGLRVAGHVAWIDEMRFGIAFDMPIDAKQLIARGQRHLHG